jgi:prolycopene isomerase
MLKIYNHVIVDTSTYTTADETDRSAALRSMLRHPVSYARFLGFLNKSAKQLLDQYFDDPEIFKFFDKLTSTYCYATVEEAPAVLAAVMFVDNHVGWQLLSSRLNALFTRYTGKSHRRKQGRNVPGTRSNFHSV